MHEVTDTFRHKFLIRALKQSVFVKMILPKFARESETVVNPAFPKEVGGSQSASAISV